MMTEQQKADQLRLIWRDNPVLGIRSLFGVDPTPQQIELIEAAWEKNARVAVSSCQGAGKTSTLTWLVFLLLLTQDDCRILITSPSSGQLHRVFTAEMAKWHHKMPIVFKNMFVIKKETIAIKGLEKIQFAQLVTASADNTENLQGGHSDTYVVFVDEASGIDDGVFDLLLGTLGVGSSQRFVMTSNPLRSAGRFHEAFAKNWKNWVTMYFDAFNSPHLKQIWIDEMAEIYGDDSDIYRVRVLGRFPRSSSTQFFPNDVITCALNTTISSFIHERYPRVCGVDVARFGDDKTVFVIRQGPKILDITTFDGLDTMEVSAELVDYYRRWSPIVINIDAIGIGAGVFDRAKALQLPVQQVIVSQKSTEPAQYMNLKSQLYGHTKTWLANGADIPDDPNLKLESQLQSIQYGYNKKMQIQMLGKKEIKKQGLDSPDIVDAITHTFLQDAFMRVNQILTPARAVVQSNYLWT